MIGPTCERILAERKSWLVLLESPGPVHIHRSQWNCIGGLPFEKPQKGCLCFKIPYHKFIMCKFWNCSIRSVSSGLRIVGAPDFIFYWFQKFIISAQETRYLELRVNSSSVWWWMTVLWLCLLQNTPCEEHYEFYSTSSVISVITLRGSIPTSRKNARRPRKRCSYQDSRRRNMSEMLKLRTARGMEHLTCMWEKRDTHRFWVTKLEGRSLLGRSRCRRQYNVEINL